MPGDPRQEAERPPWFAVIGTITFAPLFAGSDRARSPNPAHLGAVSMIAGQGLFLASTRVLAYAVVVALAFHLFVVLYEEPTLRETFGADYVAYCREVPRWVPRLIPGIRGGDRSAST